VLNEVNSLVSNMSVCLETSLAAVKFLDTQCNLKLRSRHVTLRCDLFWISLACRDSHSAC